MEKLIIEKSNGARGIVLNEAKEPSTFLEAKYLRKQAPVLPQVSEFEVVRHFTNLSRLNFCLDTHFYPLGSCTMKYNPKSYDVLCSLENFSSLHPLTPCQNAQGTLELIYKFEEMLKEITGLSAWTLQPSAGAHGEFTGALIAKAYHAKDKNRTEIIVPDTAHGTNPATAAMCGFKVVNIKSNTQGRVDLEELKKVLSPKTAMVMLTLPNTAGLFEREILEIAKLVHSVGALLYMDGANMNALIGLVKPQDMGVDIMHLNLHKTLAAPHGGGGPGAGAVGVRKELEELLPLGRVLFDGKQYTLQTKNKKSIGQVKSFWGNIAIIIRAYAYLRQFDSKTLGDIARNAVLNANYVRVKLKNYFPAFFDEVCMHECVLTISKDLPSLKALYVAKRLLDLGYHAPTIYFPLIVPQALMIEPTETESKQTLDAFIEAMKQIFEEAKKDISLLEHAPHKTEIGVIDEVLAAREPNLKW